ncbi:hypothetical protein D3C84_697790 [compost metagenome]
MVGHDVRQAIVDNDFYTYLWVFRQGLRQFRPKHSFDDMVGCGDANVTGGGVAKFGHGDQFGLDFPQPRFNGIEQTFTGLGDGYATRRPSEKTYADPSLQSLDAMTEHRLRDSQLGGRPRETLLSCNCNEREQVAVVFLCHSSFSAWGRILYQLKRPLQGSMFMSRP